MERTPKGLDTPALVPQPGTTVQTRVVEGLDLGRAGAGDDQAVVADVVHAVVANLRNLFQAAGHLPDFAPQLVHFALMEVRRGVALNGQLGVAQLKKTLLAQHRRRRFAVGAENVLHRRAWAAGQVGRGGGISHGVVSFLSVVFRVAAWAPGLLQHAGRDEFRYAFLAVAEKRFQHIGVVTAQGRRRALHPGRGAGKLEA